MTNSASGSGISRPRRWSELTPQEQLNVACCGDPYDDDTYIDDDSEDED